MTPSEAIDLGLYVRKLWPQINEEQIGVLHLRLAKVPMELKDAKVAVREEFANPTTQKINRIAAIMQRLEATRRNARAGDAAEWRPPETAAQVLLARTGPHAAGWTPLQAMQAVILADQARYRERHGEPYAKDHAWRQWTIWRSDLSDAGMTLEAATFWLVANTEVEQAWVDALEAKYAAGRARQAARMARMRDGYAPALPVAKRAAGFFVKGAK